MVWLASGAHIFAPKTHQSHFGPKLVLQHRRRPEHCRRPVRVHAYGTSSTEEEEDTYYAILGVSPLATTPDIKKAYYKVMREFHPDVSNDMDDTTEFCIFLNEVYETLSDPERRAAYDEIAGIAATGVNPFLDTSYERDKAFVDEYTCIGCRNCACVASSTFAIEEEFGRARVMMQDGDIVPQIQEAIDTCPVNCIHWVTAPQLTLLENEMRRMERASAWLLMNGGGSATNVFLEASLTWEKRRAMARDRAYAEQTKAARNGNNVQPGAGEATVSWFAKMWQPSATAASYNAAASSSDGEESTDWDQGPRPTDEVRRKTASSVASAARKWRDLKRKQRQRDEDREVPLLVASTESD